MSGSRDPNLQAPETGALRVEPTEPTEKRKTKKRKREGGGASGEGAVDAPEGEAALERMRLELERQRLELEKAKLDLEKQKLELESQARPAKSPRRASGEKQLDPRRKSGEKVDPRRRSGEKPRPSPSPEPSDAGEPAPAPSPRKVDTGRGLAIAGVVGAVAAAATVFGAIHMLNTRGPLAPAPAPQVAASPEVAPATEPRARRVSDDANAARREQLATTLTRIEVELPDALPAVFTALLAQLEVVAADRALDDALRDRVRAARATAERARHASATRGIVAARRHADAGRFREAVEGLRDVEQLGLPLPPDVIAERDRWFAARLDAEMGVTPAPAPAPAPTPPAPPPAPPPEPVAVAGGGEVRPVAPDPNDGSPPTTTEAPPAEVDAEDEAEEPDAPEESGAAAAAPAAAATPEEVAAIERDVRDRVEDWFKLRTLRSIRCMRCDGTQRNRCSGCGGDGITEVIGVNGVFRETCGPCRGGGEVPCADSLCQRGLRSLSIKRAFWDYLSPAWRKGRGHTELYRPLFEGGFAELIGPAIVVKSARIDRVEVRERDVLVVVTCEWDFYTSLPDERDELARRRIPTELTTRWVRVRKKYYLATDRDLEPERLR